MAAKLPPNPVGVAPGSSYWNDWYEKLRLLVDSVSESTGSGLLVRSNAATLTNSSIQTPAIAGPLTINGSPGITATVVLAKLTGLGANGSLDFIDGILTSYTPPT